MAFPSLPEGERFKRFTRTIHVHLDLFFDAHKIIVFMREQSHQGF